jgi:hypothetical protein
MSRGRAVSLACLLSAAAGGCSAAGEVKHMSAVATVNTTPSPNEAVVVFVRPSGWASATQSSVFDVTTAGPAALVGIVAAKMKVAYRTTPGRHIFMVVGENANFMDAMLAPGRLYHAALVAGPGWKARFVFKPVHAGERGDLEGWLAETAWVEATDDSQRWLEQNAASVEGKRARYWPKWIDGALGSREALAPDDGQ